MFQMKIINIIVVFNPNKKQNFKIINKISQNQKNKLKKYQSNQNSSVRNSQNIQEIKNVSVGQNLHIKNVV